MKNFVIQNKYWVFGYFDLAAIIFLLRFLGLESFHWPLDILNCLSVLLWVNLANFKFFSFAKYIFWYFIFITVGIVFVSFYTTELMLRIGVGFYFLARIIFNLFLKRLTTTNMFSSFSNIIILTISLLLVLVIAFSVLGDYLPFVFSVFVILLSFLHGLSLNYLFFVIKSKAKVSIIISTLMLGFHDLIGAINFFNVVIDPKFLFSNLLLVFGNFYFVKSVLSLDKIPVLAAERRVF